MTRSRRSFLLLAVVLGAAWLAIPPPAHALFQVEISSNGGGPLTFDDTDGDGIIVIGGSLTPGGSSIPLIIPTTTINGYTIELGVIATSNSTTGTGNQTALLDLLTLRITRNGGDGTPLTIRVTDQGFDFPGPPNPLMLGSSFTSHFFSQTGGGGSVSFQTFADAGNAMYGTTTAAPIIAGSAGSLGMVSGNTSVLFDRGSSGTAPYSLTSVLSITLDDGATLNVASGKTIVGVPETPAWLSASIAVGVLGVGNWWRRRRAVV